MAKLPDARASWSICKEENPQGLKLSAPIRNSSTLSVNRSCTCKCCGVRNVPLDQMTGCNCLIPIKLLERADEVKGEISAIVCGCALGACGARPRPHGGGRRLSVQSGSNESTIFYIVSLAVASWDSRAVCARSRNSEAIRLYRKRHM